MSNNISAIALVVIAMAQASNALAIYGAEYGGYNVCMGNICYHVAEASQ